MDDGTCFGCEQRRKERDFFSLSMRHVMFDFLFSWPALRTTGVALASCWMNSVASGSCGKRFRVCQKVRYEKVLLHHVRHNVWRLTSFVLHLREVHEESSLGRCLQ